jgi:hypothetical protein
MRILRRFLARVKNFAMGQRSREFGIRIAVGSDTWQRYGCCVPSGSGPDTHRHLCVGAALPAARTHATALRHQPARRDKLLLVCRFAGIDVSRRMCHLGTAVRAP